MIGRKSVDVRCAKIKPFENLQSLQIFQVCVSDLRALETCRHRPARKRVVDADSATELSQLGMPAWRSASGKTTRSGNADFSVSIPASDTDVPPTFNPIRLGMSFTYSRPISETGVPLISNVCRLVSCAICASPSSVIGSPARFNLRRLRSSFNARNLSPSRPRGQWPNIPG
jgi:hypothetical protein